MKKYFLNEREIHLPDDNDYVAVCWNLKHKRTEDKSGVVTITPKRGKSPCVDFVYIRGYDGEYYEDEDSPVDGGLPIEFARQIQLELNRAIRYYDSLEDTNELG